MNIDRCERFKMKKNDVLTFPPNTALRRKKNVLTDLNKIVTLINSARLQRGYRLSVRPRAGSENVIARAKVWERRNLSGIRTEGCFRGGGEGGGRTNDP